MKFARFAAAALLALGFAATQPSLAAPVVHYRTASIDGVNVFYREAGPADAPAIVLLHGFPSSSNMFRNLIPELADRYRVIAPDYPGFGHSDMPDRAQFRYSFANEVGEDEAKELYLGYSVPGAGEPLFQSASANLNPWTEAKVDSENPDRGPMLVISADSDQTVPWAIANAAYKKQKRNKGVTEIVKMPGRGHALTIDAGWREVAEKALEFVKRFT